MGECNCSNILLLSQFHFTLNLSFSSLIRNMALKEKLKEASTEDKLKAVDKELAALFKRCSKKDRVACVAPVLNLTGSLWWKKHSKHLIWPPIFVALIAAYVAYEPDYFMARVLMKKSMLMAFPNFDYESYYAGECLINNPYIINEDPRLPPEECKLCGHSKVDVMTNVDRKQFANELLDGRATIITDAIDRWEAGQDVDDFKFNEFVKLHLTLPEFKKSASFCTPTIRTPATKAVSTIPGVFKYILQNWKNSTLHFSASWTNCDKTGYNVIRNYYDKAYFLPEMTEVSRYQNYVLMSSRIIKKDEESVWAKLEVSDRDEGMWIGQIYRNMQIRLVPKVECSEICKPIKISLKKGEVLNLVNRFYSVYFRAEHHQSVALGVGYQFN